MNIYEKLIEVRKAVPYLKKDNKGYQFQYVSSSQTLGTIRSAMDENKLLLIPSVTRREVSDHQTKKGEHEYFTQIDVRFTWINAENPEEKIECDWIGQGLDNGEKGVGKALTYAEKYFILKFFNIATDKDDPDSFQDRMDSGKPAPEKMYGTPRTSLWYKNDADKNADSMAALEAWYHDNKAGIDALTEGDRKSVNAHVKALKEGLLKQKGIICPDAKREVDPAACKDSECSKTCEAYKQFAK